MLIEIIFCANVILHKTLSLHSSLYKTLLNISEQDRNFRTGNKHNTHLLKKLVYGKSSHAQAFYKTGSQFLKWDNLYSCRGFYAALHCVPRGISCQGRQQ